MDNRPLDDGMMLREKADHSLGEMDSPDSSFAEGPYSTPDGRGLKRKRDTVSLACDFCRSSHLKCNGATPCANCKKKSYACKYSVGRRRGRKPGSSKDTTERPSVKYELNSPDNTPKRYGDESQYSFAPVLGYKSPGPNNIPVSHQPLKLTHQHFSGSNGNTFSQPSSPPAQTPQGPIYPSNNYVPLPAISNSILQTTNTFAQPQWNGQSGSPQSGIQNLQPNSMGNMVFPNSPYLTMYSVLASTHGNGTAATNFLMTCLNMFVHHTNWLFPFVRLPPNTVNPLTIIVGGVPFSTDQKIYFSAFNAALALGAILWRSPQHADEFANVAHSVVKEILLDSEDVTVSHTLLLLGHYFKLTGQDNRSSLAISIAGALCSNYGSHVDKTSLLFCSRLEKCLISTDPGKRLKRLNKLILNQNYPPRLQLKANLWCIYCKFRHERPLQLEVLDKLIIQADKIVKTQQQLELIQHQDDPQMSQVFVEAYHCIAIAQTLLKLNIDQNYKEAEVRASTICKTLYDQYLGSQPPQLTTLFFIKYMKILSLAVLTPLKMTNEGDVIIKILSQGLPYHIPAKKALEKVKSVWKASHELHSTPTSMQLQNLLGDPSKVVTFEGN